MSIFRRRPSSEPDDNDDLRRETVDWIDRLAIPCVSIRVGPVTDNPRSSYLGGFAYLPAGMDWPAIDDEPAQFVCQIDFAAVPHLAGFPRSGLLQWFVGADDTYGLSFDDSAGADGFVLRWYDAPDAPSTHPVNDRAPAAEETYDCLDVAPGSELVFQAGSCLPAWDELDPAVREDEFWTRFAASVGEDVEDTEFAYEEYLRGASSAEPSLVQGSKIGGSATFAQQDPRGTGAYPAPDEPAGRLLVELDSAEVGGWGDGGVAHLFGDPAALADGNFAAARYHWDCG